MVWNFNPPITYCAVSPEAGGFLRVGTSQSDLHPVDDVLGDLFTLGLKEKVVQKAFVKFNVLELRRRLVVKILRSQWISDTVSRSVKYEERNRDVTKVAHQVRGNAQNLVSGADSDWSGVDQRIRVFGQESCRIP